MSFLISWISWHTSMLYRQGRLDCDRAVQTGTQRMESCTDAAPQMTRDQQWLSLCMRAVKELGIPLKKNVRLILGTDEECGSSDIRHYYSIEKEAPMTFSPDADIRWLTRKRDAFRAILLLDLKHPMHFRDWFLSRQELR